MKNCTKNTPVPDPFFISNSYKRLQYLLNVLIPITAIGNYSHSHPHSRMSLPNIRIRIRECSKNGIRYITILVIGMSIIQRGVRKVLILANPSICNQFTITCALDLKKLVKDNFVKISISHFLISFLRCLLQVCLLERRMPCGF